MTVRDIFELVTEIFMWVANCFPNDPEKGPVKDVLLREVKFVSMKMFPSGSLRAMLSVAFRSILLVFIVVLFLFSCVHLSDVPMTSAVFRKFLK